MSSKHWWLAVEALAPGSMPDDANTRPFRPVTEHHYSAGMENAADADGCDGEDCGAWPCECEGSGR